MKHLIALLFVLHSAPAFADRLSLVEVSNYLNTIKTAQAGFTQYNSDGSKSSGDLFIKRPGRARFEYDAPNEETLVLAGGGQVAVFDGRSSGRPEQYPLRRTPLNLILARKVDLTRNHMVTGHGEHRDRTIVEARDPDHPEYGSIRLFFDNSPVRLSEWIISSESGEKTRVVLEPFQNTSGFSPFLFDISHETRQRQ